MRRQLSAVGGIALLLLAWAAGGVALAAPDGATLYSRHCAACHGIDGRGGVGVPLALPSFLSSVTDQYLETTIRLGRPGRVMPGFPQLGTSEIEAIAAHVRGFANVPQVVLTSEPVVGNPERGRTLYAAHCASCHGERAEGGTGTGVAFSRPRDWKITAPALHNPGFLAAATDQMIKTTLMKGREGTPMGSFLEQGLSERDIDDVVAFVRSLENEPMPDSSLILEAEDAVLVMESSYDLEDTIEGVKRAAQGLNFRIIRVQPVNQGLVPEGQENERQVIVYFCNFEFLYGALALDPRVGLFLPCRVTVAERDGKVLVMSINPKRLSALFNNAELNRACDEMYGIYREILEEAVL
jgi:cytochrome c oxidase cbb3-type subunit III